MALGKAYAGIAQMSLKVSMPIAFATRQWVDAKQSKYRHTSPRSNVSSSGVCAELDILWVPSTPELGDRTLPPHGVEPKSRLPIEDSPTQPLHWSKNSQCLWLFQSRADSWRSPNFCCQIDQRFLLLRWLPKQFLRWYYWVRLPRTLQSIGFELLIHLLWGIPHPLRSNYLWLFDF